ncbi:MAG: hypothetical protein R3263_09275 [Myxococcota bacterium]|nr:hypothetical protein [Myxococcota bacterium]
MLQVLMGVAVLALFLVWITVGVRLLLLARRTRGFPEFALGLALLLQAGLGYPLSVLGQHAGSLETEVTALSSVFMNSGCLLIYVFTAQVFHPRSRLAWAVVGAAGALLAVHGFGSALAHAAATTEAEKMAAIQRWAVWIFLLTGGSWGWTGLESLRHYLRLRKRARLGLADPVVRNRMGLWAAMGILVVGSVVVDAALLFSGDETAQKLILPLVTSASGLAVSVLLLLAFLPPRAYLAALRRGAAGAPSA